MQLFFLFRCSLSHTIFHNNTGNTAQSSIDRFARNLLAYFSSNNALWAVIEYALNKIIQVFFFSVNHKKRLFDTFAVPKSHIFYIKSYSTELVRFALKRSCRACQQIPDSLAAFKRLMHIDYPLIFRALSSRCRNSEGTCSGDNPVRQATIGGGRTCTTSRSPHEENLSTRDGRTRCP